MRSSAPRAAISTSGLKAQSGEDRHYQEKEQRTEDDYVRIDGIALRLIVHSFIVDPINRAGKWFVAQVERGVPP